jgi:hypothetical protein
MEQWWHMLPAGSGDLVALFLQLLVALMLLGWAYNRGFRARDRGPLIRLPLLTVAYGLALVVRHGHGHWWQPVILAAAIIIAGVLGRNEGGRGLGIPMVLLAALLGHGLVLSAMLLTAVAVLVYLLSPVPKR